MAGSQTIKRAVAGAAVAGVALVAGGPVASALAGPGGSTGHAAGTGTGRGVGGTVAMVPTQGGPTDPITLWAGLAELDTDGDGTADAFGYSYGTPVPDGFGPASPLTERPSPAPSGLAAAVEIVTEQPATGTTDAATAMAVQAAIWHVVNGWDLADTNPPEVVAQYEAVLATTTGTGPVPGPTVGLQREAFGASQPPTASAGTGVVVAVRSTAAGPVGLSLAGAPAGARIVAAPGQVCDLAGPEVTEAPAGSSVCVVSPTAGTAVLHGTVAGASLRGVVLGGTAPLVDVIVASDAVAPSSTELSLTWDPADGVTTPPADTPGRTDGSSQGDGGVEGAAPQPTADSVEVLGATQGAPVATAAVTGDPQVGAAVVPTGQLPYTGVDPLPLGLAAAATVVTGGVLVVLAGRRRTI